MPEDVIVRGVHKWCIIDLTQIASLSKCEHYKSTRQETALSEFLKEYFIEIRHFHFNVKGLVIAMLCTN